MEEAVWQEEIIEIRGMHCKSCVEKVETKLLELKGVDKVRVSLVEEKAYVRFDSKQINLNAIKTEVESIGYKTDIGSEIKKEACLCKQGIIYGLIPHTGCIAFIVASVFGVTIATELFKPLLLNPYFFYILVLLSFIFATISAIIYFKKQGFITFCGDKDGLEISFSVDGIKRKYKYLATLYGTTVGINLLLLMVIFPLLANVSSLPVTGAFVRVSGNENVDGITLIRLGVDIPCPGHAPLISQELKSINGVVSVQFSFPNIFDVKYDSTKTSEQEILTLGVFKTYKANVLGESNNQQNDQQFDNQPKGTCGSSCGCGSR